MTSPDIKVSEGGFLYVYINTNARFGILYIRNKWDQPLDYQQDF